MESISTDPRANFTPTTERVRDRYIVHSELTRSAIGGPVEYAAAFDRWFATSVAAAVAEATAPVTVATEADYAALPIGTVVRGNQHGQVAERVDEEEDGGYRWLYIGYSAGFSAFEHKTIARDLGEATVLFTP
jgi:hypothetical protein